MNNNKTTKESLIKLRDDIQLMDDAMKKLLFDLSNMQNRDCATFILLFQDRGFIDMVQKLHQAKMTIETEIKFYDYVKNMTPDEKGQFFSTLALTEAMSHVKCKSAACSHTKSATSSAAASSDATSSAAPKTDNKEC